MSGALRCHLQRRYSKLLVIGALVHTIWEVGFGGASCILREQKSELGSKKEEGQMGLQPLSRVSAVQPSVGARLIVVSNRLPLTLRKTEDGWSTERSSGGLASAMNPLIRTVGGK